MPELPDPDFATTSRRILVEHQLMLDSAAVRKLCTALHMSDPSRAVRVAIDRVLMAAEAHAYRANLGVHEGNRYAPPPPLPVYLSSEDEIESWDEGD